MYKVFINNKPVCFSAHLPDHIKPEHGQVAILYRSKADFERLFDLCYSLNDVQHVFFVHPELERMWKEFLLQFRLIHAAGGIITHDDLQLLLIFRKGVWDLPKGKIEPDESPEKGAVREVCEETGICKLTVRGLAEDTWHTYVQNKKHFLKKTTWYKMAATEKQPFRLQAEEGITDARWVDRMEAHRLKGKMYPSVYMLVKKYFLTDKQPEAGGHS